MGCCLSCTSPSPNTFNTIRLVHLNGYVEDFNHPVSVSEITGKPPKQFLCTAAQLVSAATKPLNPDVQLQPGHIYFVLPLSTLHDDVSPLDMASVAKRLTARAKSIRSDHHVSPRRPEERGEMAYGLQKSCRARTRSWKPILDTIREISFTRRTESDLREMHSITAK
ncbi:hypothetical protein PTKIN_Ptkin11bG0120600 [Pterospermum kingtungense]